MRRIDATTAEPVKKTYRWPASLGGRIDRLQTLDEQRDALMMKVKELETEYSALERELIDSIPKADLQGAFGKTASVKLDMRQVPTAQDWDKLYAHIKKTGAFDLLQKRLSTTACKDRWEAKRAIPGVEPFTVIKLKLSKLK
jgi:hypothetical protein